jgi:hypothetical protein
MVRSAVLPDGLGGKGKTSWAAAEITKPELSVMVRSAANSFKLIGHSFECE